MRRGSAKRFTRSPFFYSNVFVYFRCRDKDIVETVGLVNIMTEGGLIW